MPRCISCASVAQVASSKRLHIGVAIRCTKHANTHCNMHDFGTPECTRDALASAIGRDVADPEDGRRLQKCPTQAAIVWVTTN